MYFMKKMLGFPAARLVRENRLKKLNFQKLMMLSRELLHFSWIN